MPPCKLRSHGPILFYLQPVVNFLLNFKYIFMFELNSSKCGEHKSLWFALSEMIVCDAQMTWFSIFVSTHINEVLPTGDSQWSRALQCQFPYVRWEGGGGVGVPIF